MASTWCNNGLENFAIGALDATLARTGSPRLCNLIEESFTANPKLVYNDLSWAAQGFGRALQALWTFSLQPAANYLLAQAVVNWTFTPEHFGLVFFGVGIFDPTSKYLFYVETFPAAYVVPNVGSVLTWTFNFLFGDCAYLGGQP